MEISDPRFAGVPAGERPVNTGRSVPASGGPKAVEGGEVRPDGQAIADKKGCNETSEYNWPGICHDLWL